MLDDRHRISSTFSISVWKAVCCSGSSSLVNLRERKDAVYENLRDLNFEYKAGKVPDADYTSLKSTLQDEAATLLAEITNVEKHPEAAGRRTKV